MGVIRDSKGNYKLTGKTTEHDVLAAAEGILQAKLERLGSIGNPSDASDFLRMRLGGLMHEPPSWRTTILRVWRSHQPQTGRSPAS
jgi:DNA repair protein RadC